MEWQGKEKEPAPMEEGVFVDGIENDLPEGIGKEVEDIRKDLGSIIEAFSSTVGNLKLDSSSLRMLTLLPGPTTKRLGLLDSMISQIIRPCQDCFSIIKSLVGKLTSLHSQIAKVSGKE